MKKLFGLLSTCFILLAIISCSAFNSERGSIAVSLPNSSSARSISSSGSIPANDQIEAYEIRVRNSDNEMSQKISGAKPGSTIVIDNLYPDTYTISVLAYHSVTGNDGSSENPRTFTYDSVSYYGKTTVTVYAGEKKETSITMRTFNNSGSYPTVNIYPYPDDENFFTSLSFKYSCTVTGNGVSFTYTGDETGNDDKTYGTMYCSYLDGIPNYYWNQKKETFLEPGFTYTFNVIVTKHGYEGDSYNDNIATYTGSSTVPIKQSNYENQDYISVYVR